MRAPLDHAEGPLSLAGTTLAALNADPAPLEDLFEHSPWVAARTPPPWASADALHDALMATVRAAPHADQLALIRAHPELGPPHGAELTPASGTEQSRLGYTTLTATEAADLAALNAAYRGRFGQPCIIPLAAHPTRDSVHHEMQARLGNTPAQEHEAALAAIAIITRARLDRLLTAPSPPGLRDPHLA